MPSSSKTANLQLNRWLGSDKPKKDDFNSDNEKLDAAYALMQGSVNGASQGLGAHSANAQAHITSAERANWNAKDQSAIGTYQGDGATTRKITTGFSVRFGVLYAVGRPPQSVEMDAMNCSVYSGFFGAQGATEGIAADATGFTVTNHSVNRPNGMTMRLNEPGVRYVYIAWQ